MSRREEQPKHSEYSDPGDSDEENDALGPSYFHGGGRRLDDDDSAIGLSTSRNWGTDLSSSSKVKIEDEAKENKPASLFANGGTEERGGKHL